jgi:hypothetical protein
MTLFKNVGGSRVKMTSAEEAEILAERAGAKLLTETPKDLSPARFEWLLAFTGLGDAWDALEGWATVYDRETYAALKANRVATTFRQDKTLEMVADLRPVLDQVAPEIDLTDQAIKDAWTLAENAEF